jgi:hypothetical protein
MADRAADPRLTSTAVIQGRRLDCERAAAQGGQGIAWRDLEAEEEKGLASVG